jgi:monothiol glutaredoxin
MTNSYLSVGLKKELSAIFYRPAQQTLYKQNIPRNKSPIVNKTGNIALEILFCRVLGIMHDRLVEDFSMTEQARDTEALIRDQIAKHAVLLYMKGTPQFPQCGFSARAVEALSQIGRPFAYVNILENQDIRAILPQIANWPTFPQLWINGELIGGSDIMLEMFQNGELKPLVEQYSPAPEA